MKIYVLTLFPNEMKTFFCKGIFNKAIQNGCFECEFINIRDFSEDKHQKVDDYPYGMHRGMLLKANVLKRAILSIDQFEDYPILYTCPKGQTFEQEMAKTYSSQKGLIIICGYYEGVDERIFELFNIQKVSLGHFVLSSGELPALAIVESTIRLLPGVVGNPESIQNDSILTGLLEYPQYTSPREVEGLPVPEQLLSGHHEEIRKWQVKKSLESTLFSRPSLLSKILLSDNEQAQLSHLLKEN